MTVSKNRNSCNPLQNHVPVKIPPENTGKTGILRNPVFSCFWAPQIGSCQTGITNLGAAGRVHTLHFYGCVSKDLKQMHWTCEYLVENYGRVCSINNLGGVSSMWPYGHHFHMGDPNNVQSRRAMMTKGGKCRVTIPIKVKYLQTGSLIGGWISTRCYKINMMLLR